MKLKFTFIAVVCIMQSVGAQTDQTNYVKVYRAQVPIVGDISTINEKDSVGEAIVYYDGLGREVQSVSKMGSPLGKDVVTFSTYDGYSRKTKSYLPYVSTQTDGNFDPDALANQVSYYTTQYGATDAARAYSDKVIELSDVARVREQSSPGDAWKIGSNHTVKKQYLANTDADTVYIFDYNESTRVVSVTPGATGIYAANMLTCTRTTDEEQNESLEFMDKEGRTVCRKVKLATNIYASTYYIYDKSGNIVSVIPPEGLKSIRKFLNQQ